MSAEQFDFDERPPAPNGDPVVRFALVGLAAGTGLGLVLWFAGLLSQDAAIRFVQIVNLMALGGGIGAACGYGPGRLLRKVLGLDRPGASAGGCLASAAFAALRGLYVGPIASVVAGFVLGGIGRASPACHAAPDFFSGALFGMAACAVMLSLPAAVIGAASGGMVAALLNRWQPRILIVDLLTGIITILLMLLYAYFFVH